MNDDGRCTKRKPLVFVPGLPGSVLVDQNCSKIFPPSLLQLRDGPKQELIEALKGPDALNTDDGVRAPEVVMHSARFFGMDIDKQAASLFSFLEDLGYCIDPLSLDLRQVPWDWRFPVDHPPTQERLRLEVEDLYGASGKKVVLLVHSTGGLVLYKLLEDLPVGERAGFLGMVDQVIAMGVPWAGTLKALRYVGPGEKFALGLISAAESRSIMERSWAAFDLLPLDPGKVPEAPKFVFDENGHPIGPNADRRWLHNRGDKVKDRAIHADLRLGARGRSLPGADALPITNVVGWGRKTDIRAKMVNDNGAFEMKITMQSPEGDGTVAFESASWLQGVNVRHYFLPVGLFEGARVTAHSTLWDSWPVRQLMTQVLCDSPREPFVCASVDESDVGEKAEETRVRVVGLDPDGGPLINARANFGSGSKQKPGYTRLDETGRATMTFHRYPDLTANAYHCPVVVRWEYQGATHERKFRLHFFR